MSRHFHTDLPDAFPSFSAPSSPMDCNDMTIGLAYGNLHQVRDYYTPDRSTPRLDEVYGGSQSLTAAVASQDGDILTVIFRKKLTGEIYLDPFVVHTARIV